MKQRTSFYVTLAACVVLFVVDRCSKLWALTLDQDVIVNQFLSFHLAFNRGISWGLFDSGESFHFILVNIVVFSLVLFLMGYAVQRYRSGYSILGELLVLTGAFSNIFDRVHYQGVIDFIVLSYHEYYWPVFNIADSVIVLGILIMVIGTVHESR